MLCQFVVDFFLGLNELRSFIQGRERGGALSLEKKHLLEKRCIDLVAASHLCDLLPLVELFSYLLELLRHLEGQELLTELLPPLRVLERLESSLPDEWERGNDGDKGEFQPFLDELRSIDLHSFRSESMESGAETLRSRPNLLVENKNGAFSLEEERGVDLAMASLFLSDLRNQTGILSSHLLELEMNPFDQEALYGAMRSAHSIKGAAQVVQLSRIVMVAHFLEEIIQKIIAGERKMSRELTDLFLAVTDLFSSLAKKNVEGFFEVVEQQKKRMDELEQSLLLFMEEGILSPLSTNQEMIAVKEAIPPPSHHDAVIHDRPGGLLELKASYLTELMALAGELLVEARWLAPFTDQLLKLKKMQFDLSGIVDLLRGSCDEPYFAEMGEGYLLELQHKMDRCRYELGNRLEELEQFVRRHTTLCDKLYQKAIKSRMSTFSSIIDGYPRLVRDVARELHKNVRLEIRGAATSIDRDILEKLKTPIVHLLRNAIDHGIEQPEERAVASKKREGTIILEARHHAGVLRIIVSDDGRGIDLDLLKKLILERKLAPLSMVEAMSESELYDFLYLPGFTTKEEITEISGRGVGLNVVQSMVHEVGGQIRTTSSWGKGMQVELQLPLTLSVVRSLIAEVAGSPYAFPLARIERFLVTPKDKVEVIENTQYIHIEGKNIGIVPVAQILEIQAENFPSDVLAVIVLSDHLQEYGIVVDRFLGERELVVQELDPRLGKIADISSGAFMEDGSPVFIIDVEDMVRSIDALLIRGGVRALELAHVKEKSKKIKRILVVEDSITVREVESRILQSEGYEVETAVNGVDGWNSLRIDSYDLVITDVDMPRMSGIELLKEIRADLRLRDIPVMIVSYKERKEERQLGMESGARYYLAKSSFHDDSFLEAVRDLIGEP